MNGFEHIGIYDGTNNEYYHLYDSDSLPAQGTASLRLHDAIQHSRAALVSPLQLYGQRQNDFILMLRDISQQDIGTDKDEALMRDVDDETNAAMRELLVLEMDEQRIHDAELSQLEDDVIQHLDSQIEDIIHDIERTDSEDSGPDANVFSNDWHHNSHDTYSDDDKDDDLPPNSSDDDDISGYGTDHAHDTDTDDGAHISLLQSNQQLIAFMTRQSKTITRLRKRILRLRLRISALTSRIPNTDFNQIPVTSDTAKESPPPLSTNGCATVLVETNSDTTLLIAPNRCQIITTEHLYSPTIKSQLATQLDKIKTSKDNSTEELWMYFDSGASRSVISPHSPIRSRLHAVTPAYGSCSIGDGTPLQYIEKGNVNENLEITVVKDLKYDLFSSVSAAKQGLTSIIDFDLQTGKNNSYTIDKTSGKVTPLVERGKGILELPLHLMLPPGACFTVIPTKSPTQDALPPHVVSMFWHYYDDVSFDPTNRDNNKTEYSLFTFDIIKSLSERERDFLIHARLGHLPRKKILQMIKNGTTGIKDYSGKFKELCKPCMQARQRAENHGREHKRHPKGRPGEHLHSDLAILSTPDINGNKYVLTVVDEISHEIIIALLKTKTAAAVHHVSKKIQLSITARTGNKLLTWQFDRGTEFFNSTFEQWLKLELGVIQRFSNIEHPWENGMAERSFQTLFSLARSLLKHADLPDRLWGKAILHSVYLSNRSPTAALGGIAPLQFRTKEPIDLTPLRVFGCPAQIFVRATIRDDKKLSDRSVSGTFVGMSTKGNGFIFLIQKSNTLVDIDSKDAKFNETFAEYRGRQGKLTRAPYIDPDLKEEKEDTNDDKTDTNDDKTATFSFDEGPQAERQRRNNTA
jgi:transposase InsO family protein